MSFEGSKFTVRLLMSGGLDSTACLKYYLEGGYEVHGLFIDYGQPSASLEREAACQIAEYYSTPLNCMSIEELPASGAGLVHGRNLLLLAVARFWAQEGPSILALGIRKSSPYPDCSPPFVTAVQRVLDITSEGSVVVDAPLINFDKQQVLDYLLADDEPLDLTYSCERGVPGGCDRCISCREVREAYDARK